MPPQPPVIYHLTNTQRKDLLVRATEIRVALLPPPHEIDDDIDWARSVLPTDLRDLVVAAEERDIYVTAIKDLSPVSQSTLTGHLGAITDPESPNLLQCVVAVIVTLRPDNCRHKSDKIRWPKSVNYRGVELP